MSKQQLTIAFTLSTSDLKTSLQKITDAPAQPVVSVVTVLKNRYENFRHCVRFLHQAQELSCLEHVVVDFRSTDGHLPELYSTGGLAYQHLLVEGPFTLNRGRNLGIENARSDVIFLCDADILVDPKLVQIMRDNVGLRKMYFPIIRDLQPNCDTANLLHEVRDPRNLGRWRSAGYGMCGFHRSDWQRVGRFDEIRFKKWGGDDLDFFRRAQKSCQIVRHTNFRFYHQYHNREPSFLNKHYHELDTPT